MVRRGQVPPAGNRDDFRKNEKKEPDILSFSPDIHSIRTQSMCLQKNQPFFNSFTSLCETAVLAFSIKEIQI